MSCRNNKSPDIRVVAWWDFSLIYNFSIDITWYSVLFTVKKLEDVYVDDNADDNAIIKITGTKVVWENKIQVILDWSATAELEPKKYAYNFVIITDWGKKYPTSIGDFIIEPNNTQRNG